jgi:hypothetical protein
MRASPLPEQTRNRLYSLVRDAGMKRIIAESGLPRSAIMDAIAGEPVVVGTKTLITKAIRDLRDDEDEHGPRDTDDDEDEDLK